MAVRATRWVRTVGLPALAGLWLGAFLVGCGGQTPSPEQSGENRGKNPPTAALAGAAAQKGPPAAPVAQPTRSTFKDAVLTEPPPDEQLPARTKAGKSVGKLYEQITAPGGLWDQVVFTTADGKQLAYTATIKTRFGEIQIELWPHVAPNHVRNFVALARAGYYDGLEFDQSYHEEFADEPGKYRELLVGGSPVGNGDPHYNSIGYWMKPEVKLDEKAPPPALHEEGTVGAWHEEFVESAACRFYITPNKDPSMDGLFTAFGKVTRGLDVVRTILSQPRRDEGLRERPVQPVVIESVTIASRATGVGKR